VVCPHEPLLKLGVPWVKKKLGNTVIAHVTIGTTFEVEQLNKISTIIIKNSCNVNLTAFSTKKHD
jgi:hypothetical protein